MPKKTEKRRKTTPEDVINSQADADNVLKRMGERDEEALQVIEEVKKKALLLANVARANIAELEAESLADQMRLKEYFERNPPPKNVKSYKFDHGRFGKKDVPAEIDVPGKKDEVAEVVAKLKNKIEKLSLQSAKAKTPEELDSIADEIALLKSCIKTTVTHLLVRSALKILSEDHLKELGIPIIPG